MQYHLIVVKTKVKPHGPSSTNLNTLFNKILESWKLEYIYQLCGFRFVNCPSCMPCTLQYK